MGKRNLEQVNAICETKADQMWMALDERLHDLLRIGWKGPQFEDADLVKGVFKLVAYEISKRRDAREAAK